MKKNLALSLCLLLLIINCFTLRAQNRPQTPKPPFDYFSDSVEYDNSDKTVHLGATLTYPKTKGPFTTIVLITGSGQEDRDETIFAHKPFAVIADYLTKKGYAVLRVDDRGKGKSKGELLTATTEDFAQDVITSIHYLQTRKEVNKKKIGLMGHSEGGLIAPMVYTKLPGIAFIVSLAGTGISGADILLRQQTDPIKGLVPQASFDMYFELTKKVLFYIHDHHLQADSIILDTVKKIYANWKLGKPDSLLAPLRADKATPDMYAGQIKQELIPWLRFFIAFEPSTVWQKVKCPVLALNGEKDVQVYPQQNIPAIIAALKKAGNKKVTTQILPGMNHLFQTCSKCTTDEYGKLEETFSPVALEAIYTWLKNTIR